jgi:hypothetical protein
VNSIPQSAVKPGRLKNFLINNPWYGFYGFVIGIAALGFAVYSHFASQQLPDIRYAVLPGRAVLVQGGRPSDLSVLYKNTAIEGSVTSVSIEVWNYGKKAVLPTDVLAPLQITTGDHRILEAKIVKAGRDIAELQLNNDALAKGIVGLQFRILEHNDGGVIQLIYEGDASVQVSARGVVVGQPMLSFVTYDEQQHPSAIEDYRLGRKKLFVAIGAILAVIAGGTTYYFGDRNAALRARSRVIPAVIFAAYILVLLYAVYQAVRGWILEPPIPFY